MKTILKLFIATFFIGLASCTFLDVVPVERPNDADAFKDPEALKRYMYSCYSYMPDPRNGVNSLDFMTGDEVVTAFEHENFAHFPKGGYTASNTRISYWNTLFQGIRQCYILKNNIKNVPRVGEKLIVDYTAQADFLIGYYHFLLLRCYGPTILIKEEPRIDTDPKDFLPRSSLNEVVDFIVQQFDTAAFQFDSNEEIGKVRIGGEFGLATSVIAKAMKAKTLLYVASPLFNGTEEVTPVFGKNGYDANNPIADLVPASFDIARWEAARDAAKEAIDAAHDAGHQLYTNSGKHPSSVHPVDSIQRTLRYTLCDREALVVNSELVWGDSRKEGAYGIQKKSIPYWNNGAWNGVAPTEAMLLRFYTKNGLPYQYDVATANFGVEDWYAPAQMKDVNLGIVPGRPTNNTVRIAIDREPRFYAWVAFHNGYYEVKGNFTEATANKDKHPYYKDNKKPLKDETQDNAGRLATMFMANDNCGRGSGTNLRTTNYSLTGFLNKKAVHPDCTASGGASEPPFFHWPLIRLADLYLMYAEAATECGNLDDARIYVNEVRKRAGLKTLEETFVASNPNCATGGHGLHLTKNGLRELVRSERMVELYLENQNFWDMRRWMLAGDKVAEKWGSREEGYFNVGHYGCNIDGTNLVQFCNRTKTPVLREFKSPTNYLLPLPIEEMNKNKNLVQNPGY